MQESTSILDKLVIGDEVHRAPGLSPKLERGFHSACADLKSVRKLLIYPGAETYRVAEEIEAISPLTAAIEITSTFLSSADAASQSG